MHAEAPTPHASLADAIIAPTPSSYTSIRRNRTNGSLLNVVHHAVVRIDHHHRTSGTAPATPPQTFPSQIKHHRLSSLVPLSSSLQFARQITRRHRLRDSFRSFRPLPAPTTVVASHRSATGACARASRRKREGARSRARSRPRGDNPPIVSIVSPPLRPRESSWTTDRGVDE